MPHRGSPSCSGRQDSNDGGTRGRFHLTRTAEGGPCGRLLLHGSADRVRSRGRPDLRRGDRLHSGCRFVLWRTPCGHSTGEHARRQRPIASSKRPFASSKRHFARSKHLFASSKRPFASSRQSLASSRRPSQVRTAPSQVRSAPWPLRGATSRLRGAFSEFWRPDSPLRAPRIGVCSIAPDVGDFPSQFRPPPAEVRRS
jgi:hypothetical protein